MEINKNHTFYKMLLAIAVPIAIQSFFSTSLNIVDSLMVGGLQEEALAAVGLANQYYYFFILIVFGICSGSATFTAQFWGNKDIKNIKRILGVVLLSCGIISIIFALGAMIMPNYIMSIFIKDSKTIELGSAFLRIISVSYIITSISFAYSASCRSIGETKAIMKASTLSLLCNTILNYILIYGKFGMPAMGVSGSALATVIARIVELILILRFVYKNKTPLNANLQELLNISKEFVIKFYRTTLPVIFNEALWSLGIIIYSIAYGRISIEAVAAIQICNAVQNLFMIVAKSISTASAVMIGNRIGENDNESVRVYVRNFSKLSISLGIITGILMALLSPAFVNLYNIKPEVKLETIRTLYVICMYLSVKFFNITMVVGFFRSGGDTTFACFLDAGTVWLIGIPLAFLSVLVFKLPLHWVVALLSLEEVVKSLIGARRIKSYIWMRNVIQDMG
ncbi:MATE family efflux transporter [Inconstantimicrobium mannanitabidum]|uniref:MATE family efflux transporter n=1 Tax=Inconstantimicrobium mannanitabidum TaxID=1604901 RepID=A0ACB5R7N8_9CLOT|nr:MATE family efflux transporter [Clostridium sp. TW13]GKX65204.1 MATE family efflux transporter [Clostridium sp. TW13]